MTLLVSLFKLLLCLPLIGFLCCPGARCTSSLLGESPLSPQELLNLLDCFGSLPLGPFSPRLLLVESVLSLRPRGAPSAHLSEYMIVDRFLVLAQDSTDRPGHQISLEARVLKMRDEHLDLKEADYLDEEVRADKVCERIKLIS